MKYARLAVPANAVVGRYEADRKISESSPEIWRGSVEMTALQVPVSARIRDYSSIGYASAGSLSVYDH